MFQPMSLAFIGLAILACAEESHSSYQDAGLVTASVSQARAFTSAAEGALGSIPLLQDTARTVTRRVWANADFYDVSPDGRLAVQTDWTTGDLAVRDLETGEVTRLTKNRGPFDPGTAEGGRFSRDGEWLAFSWYDEMEPAYYKLGVVDIGGANPQLIYQDRATAWIQAYDWSPDGLHILAIRTVTGKTGPELLLISPRDGSSRLLKSFYDPSTGDASRARFSPDGRYVVYDSWRDDPENSDLFVIDVGNGQEHVLMADKADDQLFDWSPDGKHILFRSDRSGTPGAWLLPVSEGRASGEPWLVKPDMWQANGVGFAADGRFFYIVDTSKKDIYVASFDPETRSIIGSPTAVTARSPSNSIQGIWSPDGRHLLYIEERGPTSAVDRIAVRSMETGDTKVFHLGEPGWVGAQGWTPDGRSVLVRVHNTGNQEDGYKLYRIDVQTGQKEALKDPRRSIPLVYPRAAAAPEFLVYLVSEENAEGQAAFHILRHDLETGDSTVLFQTPFGAWGQVLGPAMSPDGRTLAFGYSPVVGSQPKSVVLLPVSGEDYREIPVEDTRGPVWTPDGQGLFFLRFVGVGPIWEMWYLGLSEQEPRPVGLTVRGNILTLDVHPDGRKIAYTSGKGGTELWVMENFLPVNTSGR